MYRGNQPGKGNNDCPGQSSQFGNGPQNPNFEPGQQYPGFGNQNQGFGDPRPGFGGQHQNFVSTNQGLGQGVRGNQFGNNGNMPYQSGNGWNCQGVRHIKRDFHCIGMLFCNRNSYYFCFMVNSRLLLFSS